MVRRIQRTAQPSGQTVFPFGFLLSLQAKSRIEMAKDEPDALSHELWRRREPRPAAPYFKQPSEAKDHAFDRERGGAIPGVLAKVPCAQSGPLPSPSRDQIPGRRVRPTRTLKRRHVFALAQQSIGKEADNIEENEFIGEDADPPDYGVELTDRAAIAAAVFDIQNRYGISDRRLLEEAKVSHHTLAGLREGKRIGDASLMKLFRAAEALRQEADPVAAAMDTALKDLRRLKEKVGGRNKLAKLLGVTGPYIGRVLQRGKADDGGVGRKLAQIRHKLAMAAGH